MSKNIIFVICVAVLANAIHAEVNDQSVSRNEQSLDKGYVNSKLGELIDQNGIITNSSLVPDVRQGEEMLYEMCKKAGGNASFDTASNAIKNIKTCFNNTINFAELPAKIEAARPIGELDTVFKDYCLMSDDLKGCVNKFLSEVEPCLSDSQKTSKYTIQNITENILKFACENEGDHIALFISEKGPQCISEKQPGIEKCVRIGMNETKTRSLYEEAINGTSNISSLNSIGSEQEKPFSFTFELDQCRNFYQIRNCIIEELRTCSGSTPANVVESIFNLIQSSTTCRQFTLAQIDPNYNSASHTGGVSILQSMFSIIIPILTIMTARTFSS